MQKLMKAIHQNEKGFTLVELMVVVVIIGILIAIAIPLYSTVQETARKNACFANQRTIDGSIAMYRAEGGTLAINTGAGGGLDSADLFVSTTALTGPGGPLGPYLQAAPRCPRDTLSTGPDYEIVADRVVGCPVTVASPLVNHGRYGS